MTDFPPLSLAMRNNLLSLSRTQTLVDKTVLRLATGLRVNSALDDPRNFFQARSLEFRADDLSRRLDAIGQSLSALKEANNGIEASLELLDVAETYLLDVLEQYQAGEIVLTASTPLNVTNIRPAAADFTSYAGFQDSGGPVTVTNGGEDFTFTGNLWKQLSIDYTITSDTVLEFEYASTNTLEISSIGFDSDNNFGNNSERFFLNGTQTGGLSYAAPIGTYQYTGAGDYQSYSIPVGMFFTGTFSNMTFINDHDVSSPMGNSLFRNVSLREGPIELSSVAPTSLGDEYRHIINQLDALVEDTHYRDAHLLRGDDMEVVFNESGSSRLLVEGLNASSKGLGLHSFDLDSIDAVRDKISDIRDARETLRTYSSSLASDLNIISTRQSFTNQTINTLLRGADLLTVADQNEEGANILALQTRQTLGVTALSLASQSSNSVLNLFA